MCVVFLVLYQVTLATRYAYEGMYPIELDASFFVVFFFFVFLIYLVLPANGLKPSDFYIFFYLVISVIWNSVLWRGTRFVSIENVYLYIALLFSPVFVFMLVRRYAAPFADRWILPVQLGTTNWAPWIFVLLLLAGGLGAYLIVGAGSLDWQNMYERRLSARDKFAEHAIASYVVSMATNSALPILGFYAGYRRSVILVLMSAAFIFLMFFLVGLKSPAINFAGLSALGFLMSLNSTKHRIFSFLLSGIFVVYVIALFLYEYNGSMFIADYLVRRISMVQPQLQTFYFDFYVNMSERLSELHKPFSDTTYAIGRLYFGSDTTNANTNAFFYELSRGGLYSYGISIFVVALIYVLIDCLWEKTGNPGFFSIAALFAVLLSEQAWTAVLLTSGVALSLALIMLFSYTPDSARRQTR